MPNFEVYTRGGGRKWGQPTVTLISGVGRLTFSPAAFDALGSPEAVAFLVDREEQLIGFRAASAEEPNAYRLNPASRTMSAVSVLRYMGIDRSESRRWPLLCDSSIPHIDLKQPGTPVTSNRRKK